MRGTEGLLGIKPWDIAAGGLLLREGRRADHVD